MLSPKNHIRGKCMRNATDASVDCAAVQPDERPALSRPLQSWSVESSAQYFAIAGHSRGRKELYSNGALQSMVDRIVRG
jgi:hypothetical protein